MTTVAGLQAALNAVKEELAQVREKVTRLESQPPPTLATAQPLIAASVSPQSDGALLERIASLEIMLAKGGASYQKIFEAVTTIIGSGDLQRILRSRIESDATTIFQSFASSSENRATIQRTVVDWAREWVGSNGESQILGSPEFLSAVHERIRGELSNERSGGIIASIGRKIAEEIVAQVGPGRSAAGEGLTWALRNSASVKAAFESVISRAVAEHLAATPTSARR